MLRNARSSLSAVKRHIPTQSIRARPQSTTHTPSKPSSFSPPNSPPSNAPKQRHYEQRSRPRVNDKNTPVLEKEKPLLQPYVLSDRLTKLCDEGKLDEAIETLKNMPLDAQNTAVWNGMIRNTGREGRFQLAYQLYVEMKRRGFKPNGRTYSTLMGVFAKVPTWKEFTKVLQNVHTTYENYLAYLEATRVHNPQSPELSIAPINGYISVLSKAREWQRMFDVYNSLDTIHLPPNKVTYTIMLNSLGNRSTGQRGDDAQAQAVRERAASDARLLWRQMLKRIDKSDIDAHLVDAVVPSLALGRPADQIVAFDILRDYVGLAKPGETVPPPSVELSPPLLSDVLWLCNTSKKHRLTVHFVQQLMKTNPGMLDRGHMDHVLAAYGSLSAMGSATEASRALQTLEWMLEQTLTAGNKKIHPGRASYTLALVACWRGKDWESALRIFELMTGYLGKDFADGTAVPKPTPTERSSGFNVLPDAAAMSCLVRAAHASGEPAHMRQCVRILHHLGLSQYLGVLDTWRREGRRTAPRFKRDASFYAYKTAAALTELVDVLVPKKMVESAPLTDEQREWVKLRSEARAYLAGQQRPQFTPQLEEQLLGSERGLAAMDDAVAWDRISREQKTK